MKLEIGIEDRGFRVGEMLPILCRVQDEAPLIQELGIGFSLHLLNSDSEGRAPAYDKVIQTKSAKAMHVVRLGMIPHTYSYPDMGECKLGAYLAKVSLWTGQAGTSKEILSSTLHLEVINNHQNKSLAKSVSLAFLALSERDLQGARTLLGSGQIPLSAVMLIEALEKALKAYATYEVGHEIASAMRHKLDEMLFYVKDAGQISLLKTEIFNKFKHALRGAYSWDQIRTRLRYPYHDGWFGNEELPLASTCQQLLLIIEDVIARFVEHVFDDYDRGLLRFQLTVSGHDKLIFIPDKTSSFKQI